MSTILQFMHQQHHASILELEINVRAISKSTTYTRARGQKTDPVRSLFRCKVRVFAGSAMTSAIPESVAATHHPGLGMHNLPQPIILATTTASTTATTTAAHHDSPSQPRPDHDSDNCSQEPFPTRPTSNLVATAACTAACTAAVFIHSAPR